jgi:hypothetical protein
MPGYPVLKKQYVWLTAGTYYQGKDILHQILRLTETNQLMIEEISGWFFAGPSVSGLFFLLFKNIY